MQVYYIKSIYSLLLGLLIVKVDNKNSFFLLDNTIPDKIKENILKKYKGIELNENFVHKKILKYFIKKEVLIRLKKVCENFSKDSTVYGYTGDSFVGDFLKERFEYNILEDGVANYNLKSNQKKKIKIIDWILGGSFYNYPSQGLCEKTNRIYLTGLSSIPEEIKEKVMLVNMKEQWDLKSEDEKNEILEIFSIHPSEIEILKNGKNILFTQPLSEDGILSEDEKIELYRKIMKNYSEEEVLIKPHPREKTDYKKVFQKVTILKRETPFELLVLLGVKLEKAITIFSTAAFSLEKSVEIDFYGTEIHSKLYKHFGGLENIKIERKKLEE